ncbi:DUF2157 domain-containing protein [Bradyrhizobium sp. AUGA SZCCT0160]|uniref:DUF2157 domain-containing protein n=1 Tax=Bradyrhizobium sp. AUGA SZCCT0160 TaxID=2807662 RepID=UPI001BAE2914|nr:DUF2157 domain-containing protein [Bradyrhizobium sp. AUGA SZCCT0160]MBR1191315.1 DUF2157 domain-containing protein [Bradyrhizobium sp. AUGA SZCCT0160]
MFERGYRQRLEADLVKWVAEGVISGDAAHSIRKARFGEEATSRLPAIFAMLGALMLAASVSAFVAANWQEIPRLVRLVGILTLIAACFPVALLLGRRAIPWGADAAVTFATLCFGAGVALVGQMYHLPGDWPAGAMLVAIGALIAAALTGKSGPLVIAFAAMAAWTLGRSDDAQWHEIHWPFFLLFVPAFALALGRENRLVAHAAVLALSVWLASLIWSPADRLIHGGIAFSIAYIAIGLLALDRDWPAEFRALLPWGGWAFGVLLCFEIELVLEKYVRFEHAIDAHLGLAYVAAALAIAALAGLARGRDKGRLVIITACAIGLTIPLMLAGGPAIPSRVLIPIAVLVSAVALIAGGLLVGLRTFFMVGYAVFGFSILILLWRTVGTLLDQSLFFLAAGVVLLGLALGARKLASWSNRANEQSSGSAA